MTDTGRRTTTDGTCRRCGGDLLWAWLVSGRRGQRVPLEPAERKHDDDVARYAVSRDHLGRLRARILELGERPASWERAGVSHLAVCRVLVERREARASLRRAKSAAPSFADAEALREARQQASP